MTVQFGSSLVQVNCTWITFKATVARKRLTARVQFDESATEYLIFAIDGSMVYQHVIYRGVVPYRDDQAANDEAKAEFETDWKDAANAAIEAIEADGRQIVAAYPAQLATQTQFTGEGDDIANGTIGGGPSLEYVYDGTETFPCTKSVDVQFITPIQLADGAAIFSGAWSAQDRLTFAVTVPANVPVANPGNTGNCNKVDTGLGFNLIVPAAGDGAWDINLALACPVIGDIDNEGTGFWWVEASTGAVSAAPLQNGNAQLLDVEQTYNFIQRVPIGAADGHWDIDVYRAEYIHQNWFMRGSVTKTTPGAGVFSGEMLIYRMKQPL